MTQQEAHRWRERAELAERELARAVEDRAEADRRYVRDMEQALGRITAMERERDEARTGAARQLAHDHAHLMAEAAAHGRTQRWARLWKAAARISRRHYKLAEAAARGGRQ